MSVGEAAGLWPEKAICRASGGWEQLQSDADTAPQHRAAAGQTAAHEGLWPCTAVSEKQWELGGWGAHDARCSYCLKQRHSITTVKG